MTAPLRASEHAFLDQDSVVLCQRLQYVDKVKLRKPVGRLSVSAARSVDMTLLYVLQL